jgi:hypothetical protein
LLVRRAVQRHAEHPEVGSLDRRQWIRSADYNRELYIERSQGRAAAWVTELQEPIATS